MSEWFSESFRKIHKLYVSPQWAGQQGAKFDAAQYADYLADTAVDCLELYCKDHHGTCYYPCSLGMPHPRNILGELLPELKKRDIRLIAYVSICFDNYALGIHPEWRMVNYLGDPYKLRPFYMASICSPYTDFVLQQIDELASTYAVDGFWLDIIPLARDVRQDIWMIAPHPIPDYSFYAQRAYEAATGEQLPLRPTPDEADGIFEFMTAQVDGFLERAYALIRRHLPDAIVTYNAAGAPGDPVDSADLISIEGHAPNYVRQSFNARWAKTRGKPFEILTAGATDQAQFDGFGQVFRPVLEIEPWLRDASGVSDIGLVFAPKPRTASNLWGIMQDGAEAFHDALLDMRLQYDIIQFDADLSQYQLLILPDQAALSDEELDKLRAYVREGGKLLASGCSALWDETGKRRADFGLADVFGASYQRDAGSEFVYLRLTGGGLRETVTALPILIDKTPLQVKARDSEVIAEFILPEAGRSEATTVLWGDAAPDDSKRIPAIMRKAFGQGECAYIAAPLRAQGMPNAWVKRFMAVLAAQLVERPVLKTNAPAGVEVVLNRQGQRHIIHLLNRYSGSVDHLSWKDERFELRDIAIELDLSRLAMNAVQRVFQAPDTGSRTRRFCQAVVNSPSCSELPCCHRDRIISNARYNLIL